LLNYDFAYDLLLVLLIFNFIKIIGFSSLLDLIWPTQFFNRRHDIGFKIVRFRTYTETILKLINKTPFYTVLNKYLINFFFFK
jgi:hypothetical protein